MISPEQAAVLNTICSAAKEDELALMECTMKATGEKVAVLAHIHRAEDENDFLVVPLAMLFTEDPFEILERPK